MRNSVNALLAGAAVAALAGCGTQAATSTTTSTAPKAPASTSVPATATPAAGPANPVTIISEAGATPEPGAVYGSNWMEGLTANGSFSKPYDSTSDHESVTVYTLNPGTTGEQAAAQIGAVSSDSQVIITGPDFYIYVDPAQNQSTGTRTYLVAPGTIALRVHGTVQAPGGQS